MSADIGHIPPWRGDSEAHKRRTRGAQAPHNEAMFGVSRRHDDAVMTGEMGLDDTLRVLAIGSRGDS